MSPLEHKLNEFMILKEELDTSKMLLSPMPGALVSVAVEIGQTVEPGQELAVVEAMKMQNVLTAPRDGVVKELLASAGATLSADQAILSFEDATKAARA